jgi:RNA polymerase sigma factor (sigma-70 family)
VDETDARIPVVPSACARNSAIVDEKYDSVASVLQVEWAACYGAEMPQLTRYLMKCFSDCDLCDAVDAAHSAFAELFSKWDTVRNPRPWLRTVAFRYMLRQPAKAERPLDALVREPSVPSDDVRLEWREEEQRILDALRQLPATQRQVLALLCDQFPYREIAEIMNMSEPAVRKNAERARARMKQILGIT